MASKAVPVAMGTPVQPGPGGFNSGLCDCCSDCCSCWATMCCWPIVIGQMSYRLLWNKKGICLVIASLLWVSIVMSWFASSAQDPEALEKHLANVKHELSASYSYDSKASVPSPTASPTSSFSADEGDVPFWVAALAAMSGPAIFVLTCLIRQRVRQRDGIPATCCSGWMDDCIHSCCCWCCVLSQLMRHEGLVGDRYKLSAEDGVRAMV